MSARWRSLLESENEELREIRLSSKETDYSNILPFNFAKNRDLLDSVMHK